MSKKPNKKADVKIKLPTDKKDKTHKNPNLENENHTEEVNDRILKLAEKFGEDYIVVTHFVDGTAISIADKAKKKDKDGNEALPYVRWRIEDDYVWIGLRTPTATGTVI